MAGSPVRAREADRQSGRETAKSTIAPIAASAGTRPADEQRADAELGPDQAHPTMGASRLGSRRYWLTPSMNSRGARAFSTPASRQTPPRPDPEHEVTHGSCHRLPLRRTSLSRSLGTYSDLATEWQVSSSLSHHTILTLVALLDRALVRVLPAVPRSIVRKISERYIAGSRVEDACGVVKS